MLFENLDDNKKVPLACFHQHLAALVDIYNKQSGTQENISKLDEASLEAILCAIEEITVTYNFANAKVSSIEQ